ncbi:helix-turn-helix transcriptional regulator [Halorarum halophilum]|uniref:Helix-turn-helix transcriptional regulator n=1 Tax=Halorarum halophilum TaxID=2743090 RepID=A0A7D5GK35_9EURY|nr:helix-turn-helix transcriptional regulator [Halobaculum halophilum]QLG26987.1 helix-turn-helix transcriptional regulator [Halobaculum halophilum]
MTRTKTLLGTGVSQLDRLFTCLSHPNRRRILTTLAESGPRGEDGQASISLDPNDGGLEVPDGDLAPLERAGFVSWDRRSGTVTRGPNFETVRPFISLVREHREELPEDWPEPVVR